MDENILTINEQPIESSATVDFTDSLIIDQPIDEPAPEAVENTKDVKEETKEEVPEKTEAQEDEPKKDRFDQEPRFQEVIKQKNSFKGERDEYKAKLDEANARLKALESIKKADVPDVLNMSQEEIHNAFDENPKEFLSNLVQATENRVLQRQMETVSAERNSVLNDRINQTFENFEKGNPDFRGMWDSGELKQYMDANPGHNAISAYHELTGEKRMQEAVQKAEKDAEKRILANLKAKGNAKSLDSGPAAKRAEGIPDELKNPEKYGGAIKVLTERFKQRQAG